MPKVSVVISCYNYARFLPDAVGSVVRQTYPDFEIVIVNDGSTDGTAQVASSLVEKYKDTAIRVINQQNQGAPAARNTGIRQADGEIILALDADDMIEPDYLEKAVRVLDEEPGISAVYTDLKTFGDAGEAGQIWAYKEPWTDGLLDKNTMPSGSMYRKSAWEKVGGYKPLKGYEDWEFWIALHEAGFEARHLKEPLFLYRRHGLSRVANSQKMHEELCSQIRRLHPKLFDAATLENILRKRDRQAMEKDIQINELKAYIDEIHTFGGFMKRAARAALRRLGVRI